MSNFNLTPISSYQLKKKAALEAFEKSLKLPESSKPNNLLDNIDNDFTSSFIKFDNNSETNSYARSTSIGSGSRITDGFHLSELELSGISNLEFIQNSHQILAQIEKDENSLLIKPNKNEEENNENKDPSINDSKCIENYFSQFRSDLPSFLKNVSSPTKKLDTNCSNKQDESVIDQDLIDEFINSSINASSFVEKLYQKNNLNKKPDNCLKKVETSSEKVEQNQIVDLLTGSILKMDLTNENRLSQSSQKENNILKEKNLDGATSLIMERFLRDSIEYSNPNKVTFKMPSNENLHKSNEMLNEKSIETSKDSCCSSTVNEAKTQGPKIKFPIQVDKKELVWECVDVNQKNSKDLLLKNQSNFRITINLEILNDNFKFKIINEKLNKVNLLFHSNETKVIEVIFCPKTIGACSANLELQMNNVTTNMGEKMKIKLFGYGGKINFFIDNIIKLPQDIYVLPLGRLIFNKKIVENKFYLQNFGSIPAFAYLNITSDYLFLKDYFKLQPNCIIIEPGDKQQIDLVFDPKKNVLKVFNDKENIKKIGCIEIINGANSTRFRIRRLMKKKGVEFIKNSDLNFLFKDFVSKNNDKIVELNQWKESVNVFKDLCINLKTIKIDLILEKDLTPNAMIVDNHFDETTLYQTLYPDQTTAFQDTIMDY